MLEVYCLVASAELATSRVLHSIQSVVDVVAITLLLVTVQN